MCSQREELKSNKIISQEHSPSWLFLCIRAARGNLHIQQADHDEQSADPSGQMHGFAENKDGDDAARSWFHGDNHADPVRGHVFLTDGLKEKSRGTAEQP